MKVCCFFASLYSSLYFQRKSIFPHLKSNKIHSLSVNIFFKTKIVLQKTSRDPRKESFKILSWKHKFAHELCWVRFNAPLGCLYPISLNLSTDILLSNAIGGLLSGVQVQKLQQNYKSVYKKISYKQNILHHNNGNVYENIKCKLIII